MSSTLFSQVHVVARYRVRTGWQYSFGIMHQLRGFQRRKDRLLCLGHRPLEVGLGRHYLDFTVESVVVVFG
jgi:hypothetical protein